MDQSDTIKTEAIKNEIEDSKRNIVENWETLEGRVKTMKDNVIHIGQRLNPIHQTRIHPLTGVAVAVVAGASLGALVGSSSRQGARGEPILKRIKESQLVDRFKDEIEMVKNLAIGAGIKQVAGFVMRTFPAVQPEVERVLKTALKKCEPSDNAKSV